MISIHEDFSLFDEFREGSRKALAAYFGHYGEGIHYLLEKKTGSGRAAKEATIETFNILYESRHVITSPTQLWAFLYSTAKRVASKYAEEHEGQDIDVFRSLGGRRPMGDENEKRKMAMITDPGLARVVEQLTPRQREVAACYRAGMTTREIADFLQLSPQTVLNHKTHGIERLKSAFGDKWAENNPFLA